MKKYCLVGILFVSACSGNWDNSHATACEVSYKLETYPQNNSMVMGVDKVRYDRFGDMSVHPIRSSGVNFFGSGWISSGEYKNINCR